MIFSTPGINVQLQENALSSTTKKQMWTIYQKSFKTTEEQFYQEIEQYDYISFFKNNGQIKGFVGIQIDAPKIHGQAYLLVRFGQAVIQESYRGKALIPITGLKLCRLFWRELLDSKVVFWANALTYKSYLVFAKMMDSFYPTHRQPTPYQLKEVMDFIGEKNYKTSYDKATGTIKAKTAEVDDVSKLLCYKYQEDADIRFFTQANPQHEEGEGLITLTKMDAQNVWTLLKKYVKQFLPANFKYRTPFKYKSGKTQILLSILLADPIKIKSHENQIN